MLPSHGASDISPEKPSTAAAVAAAAASPSLTGHPLSCDPLSWPSLSMDTLDRQPPNPRPPPLPIVIPSPLASSQHAADPRHSPASLLPQSRLRTRTATRPASRSTTSSMTRPAIKPPVNTTSRIPSSSSPPRSASTSSSAPGKSLLPSAITASRPTPPNMTFRDRIEAGLHERHIPPDPGSLGREGRQFTVANVGNNGRIYLRPAIRPASQRHPQPVLTPTTPLSAGILHQHLHHGRSTDEKLVQAALSRPQWTPPQPVTSSIPQRPDSSRSIDAARRLGRRRAMSDSTIHEPPPPANTTSKAPLPTDMALSATVANSTKAILDRLDAAAGPILDISIPSWRIGTPRFTLRGTPIIRSSSYAPTEELQRSLVSLPSRSSHGTIGPPSMEATAPTTRAPSPNPPPLRPHPMPQHLPLDPGSLSPHPQPSPTLLPPTSPSLSPAIEPAMFTDLTFKPACDDRSVVRYSSAGVVIAATPPRLVAEITSPSFLDYELISDFFLTFRSFLDSMDLLRMLFARLRWAVSRSDEAGVIVRVRTFVAMRHWILNYFADDFVLDYDLRVVFCNLTNEFADELSRHASGRNVQLKILAELKKCWRRVCAQFWDGQDFDDSLGPDVAVAPGGVAGHRNPRLEPGYWERQGIEPPQLDVWIPSPKSWAESVSLYAQGSGPAHIGDFIVLGNRPGTPENPATGDDATHQQESGSPLSVASTDVISCSIPTKNIKALGPHLAFRAAAHPAPASALCGGSGNAMGQSSAGPRARHGRRARPVHKHNRSNSLSDSLRDQGSDKSSLQEQDPLARSAGSLVRGNLLPPGQAFVNVEPAGYHDSSNRYTSLFQAKDTDATKERPVGGAMSGYGMRKLIGSVRRAMSSRGQGLSPTQGSFMGVSSVGPRGATTNRLPGSAVVPQDAPRQNGTRPRVRIDLLGAEVAEDFKKAIREEEEEEEEEAAALGLQASESLSSPPPATAFSEYSVAQMDSSTLGSLPQEHKTRPVSDMAITNGSKSILIVDDTAPPETRPPPLNLVPDPTPPSTPPADPTMLMPKPSMPLVSRHALKRPRLGQAPPPPESAAGPHVKFPPTVEGTPGKGLNQKYSGTHQSLKLLVRRGYASFSSGASSPPPPPPPPPQQQQQPPTQSLAAADDSAALVPEGGFDVEMPPPLRILRRRPGGDLKAVTNVGDLDRMSPKRPQSAGSLTTFADSIRSSYLLSMRPISAGHAASSVGPKSEDPEGAATPRGRPSLMSIRSSKPPARPSFEAEAQKLAQIPDDEEGAGIESALLKLEGRYGQPRRSCSSVVAVPDAPTDASHDTPDEAHPAEANPPEDDTTAHRTSAAATSHGTNTMEDPARTTSLRSCSEFEMQRPDSEEDVMSVVSHRLRQSYSSIPLLERGLLDDETSVANEREWRTNPSLLCGPDEGEPPAALASAVKGSWADEDHSFDDSRELSLDPTDSTVIGHGGCGGGGASSASLSPSSPPSSSSSMTDGRPRSPEAETPLGVGSGEPTPVISRLRPGPGGGMATRTAAKSSRGEMTLVQALAMSPEQVEGPEEGKEAGGGGVVWNRKPLPPTPQRSPASPLGLEPTPRLDRCGPSGKLEAGPEAEKDGAAMGTTGATTPATRVRKYSVHLPFILAFDSEILAQQFTLIEKDALNEIDWKDLIDMKWQNASGTDPISWVDFLRHSDARGVEVVIARFNIMVKWAVSEIVLTQHAEERARCVSKLIHVAAHCRRYRNFATLAQLTIALTGNHVARLAKTWALVPAQDVKTLDELERLITPTRNFYAIRAEMEVGSDAGCIPFMGIYTHDLLFNAQRPSQLREEGGEETEKKAATAATTLVNFERCRVAAAVVKTVLRLLEASTRYEFEPVEGITERCLWMGALGEGEIRRHAESLE